MPSLPSLPSIPIPPIIATLFSNFPLITYEAPPTSIPAPSLPTLWLLGPLLPSLTTSSNSKKVLESLDPYCRILQSLARFLSTSSTGEEQQEFEVRWMKNEYGVVGGRLPNLHLPDGSLLGKDEKGLNEYFKDPKKWRLNAGNSIALVEEQKSLSYEAFEILVRKTLLPAVLSLAYFSEKKSSSSTSSKKVIEEDDNIPYLSSWVAWYDSIVKKQSRVDEVKLLSSSRKGVLDLEEVERVGIETIGTLEIKFREDAYGAEGWFGGSVYVS